MTQIINIIAFIKELLCGGRQENGKRKDHTFRNLLLTAVCVCSFWINYITIREVFVVTTQVVKLKAQVKELKIIEARVVDLEKRNEILGIALSMVKHPNENDSFVTEVPAHKPPVKEKKDLARPLPSVPRPSASKNASIEGKTPGHTN